MARLEKLYEKLTARERLDLILEALIRIDATELGRLTETVPLGTWKMPDPTFYFALHRLMLLGHFHALARVSSQVAFLLALILRDAGANDRDPESVDEGMNALAVDMASLDEGWRQFCAEIGYSDEMIAEAFLLGEEPEIDQVFDALFADAGIVADREMPQQIRKQYLAKWVRLSPLA